LPYCGDRLQLRRRVVLTKLTRRDICGNPAMHRKLLSILVLSILVASTLAGCGQGQPTATPAILATSGGDVSVMKTGTSSWTEPEVGMCLGPGDCIKCGGNSAAEITFLDGSTIELDAGTEIEIIALNISTETDSVTIRVKQTIGRIIFRVVKIIDPASRYEVETPAGVVAIRGSAAEIYVTEDGTTWVCNLEGDIWASAQGVDLQIPEGRCCVIRPGQPPTLICELTISSAIGGSVTTPGEGTFSYDEGTVVNVTAEAEKGYQFGIWTGDVGSMTSVNAATTTITMQDNYSVTANFEEDEVVTFPDPNLEAAVRQAISEPEDPIYASDLDGLTGIDASVRNVTDLTGLEYATSLTGLDLEGNQISDVSPLASLTGLTGLGLAYNQISDISPLANLIGLTRLGLNYNQISDVSPLSTLTSLAELGLEGNQISDISPLSTLTSLAELGLAYNQISDISSLANLTGLTRLGLSSNQIGDISSVANLTSLRDLVLWSNQISDIWSLANLTNVTYLNLGSNQISNISPLANLTSLTRLYLHDNQIGDISPLVQNEGLGTGDLVNLQANALSSDSVNIYIPELQARGVAVYY